jgi:hypothetical protein
MIEEKAALGIHSMRMRELECKPGDILDFVDDRIASGDG